jgi:hypothetical protein
MLLSAPSVYPLTTELSEAVSVLEQGYEQGKADFMAHKKADDGRDDDEDSEALPAERFMLRLFRLLILRSFLDCISVCRAERERERECVCVCVCVCVSTRRIADVHLA